MIVRPWTPQDIPAITRCHQAAFPEYESEEGYYEEEDYLIQFEAFPEGQFLAELQGQVIGYATALIVQFDIEYPPTYLEITGNGTFCTHDPTGDTLYGAEIAVHPNYQRRGAAKHLYQVRFALLKQYNLRRMIAYGRLPSYVQYAQQISLQEYVAAVVRGDLADSALTVHLKVGYQVNDVLEGALQEQGVLDVCTLLELLNPDYNPNA